MLNNQIQKIFKKSTLTSIGIGEAVRVFHNHIDKQNDKFNRITVLKRAI